MRTLTANIALELGYALDGHRAALFVSGLILLALIVLLVSMSDWIMRDDSGAAPDASQQVRVLQHG